MTVLHRTDLTTSQKIECAAAAVARQHEHGSNSNSRWRVSSLRVAGWSRWAGSAVTARASAPLAVSRCVDFAAPSPPEHPARRTPDHRSERDYEVS